ncbi:MAG: YihA family ribosome biogenesis GTP-binding protein [Clostridia bacterium]|nr:YihA family ribosome biogenesis GTP-binding protein [Clostridia bacterium]
MFKKIDFVRSAGAPNQFLRDGRPHVVFSGKSNVGKSSAICKLANRKNLARVSAQPGKTVTVNFFLADDSFYLVDLPGYGYAKRPRSQIEALAKITEGYLFSDCPICLILQLLDLRHPPTADDLLMIDWLRQSGRAWAVLATKADKLSPTAASKALEALRQQLGEDVPVIAFSAQSGQGKEQALAWISSAIMAKG